jgi:hypothetical protein
MPAIADQVAALEHDHDDALAMIDTLSAANAALMDDINAITAEKAALQARIDELSTQADAMTAMAEKVANSALDMLKAARLPAGTPVEVIPFAPMPKPLVAASVAPSLGLADMLKPKPAALAIEAVADDAAPPKFLLMPRSFADVPIQPLSAVDLVKRRLLPALTLMRRPTDRVTNVVPHAGGLPPFLRRDTVFARSAA